MLSVVGCQSPAQQEVYSRKMANQIRVLEDQLYDADYQNRVLRDELKRAKDRCKTTESSTTPSAKSRRLEQSYGPPIESIPSDPVQPLRTLPLIDPNPTMQAPEPLTPAENIPAPTPITDPNAPTILDEGFEDEAPANETSSSKLPYGPAANKESAKDDFIRPSDLDESPEVIPTPPAEAMPPGPESTNPSPVTPRDLPAPPNRNGEGEQGLRIPLPKSLEDLSYTKPKLPPLATPDHIQLHPTLSGGHQFDQDDEVDGMYVVVNVVDKEGDIVNLRNFDIGAELTIVVLDPAIEGVTSRIGRWDFSPEEVGTFIRTIPVDGLHVPIKWQDNEPSGEEVIVHVRLQSASEEMNCQAKVKLQRDSVMAKWLPRGKSLR